MLKQNRMHLHFPYPGVRALSISPVISASPSSSFIATHSTGYISGV